MTFAKRVYGVVQKVPAGKVTTYKDVAHALNSRAYRAIGQVLKNNPSTDNTPCHRVVASSGKVGGYFGSTEPGAVNVKKELLLAEGVSIRNDIVDPTCIISFDELLARL